MAQASALLTYEMVTNREDLGDVIYNISKTETPFLSRLSKTKATNTYHEWVNYELEDPADNAQIEGFDWTFTKPTPTTRNGNYTQIFYSERKVSDTQRAVNPAGYEDEFAFQAEGAMKEHATDIEYALINGTGNSGASGTARRLKGILAAITTTVNTGTGTADEALTETMFNDTLQDIWEEGGRPDEVYVNGTLKRKIDSFVGNANAVNTNSSDEKRSNVVSYYYSSFGSQRVYLHWMMPEKTVAILQQNMFAVANLRPTAKKSVPKQGSHERVAIETELTLEYRQEKSSGKITGAT